MSFAQDLHNFVVESNRIEGILREPTELELEAHDRLLARSTMDLHSLETFVATVQPGATLRTQEGMNVRVGRHYPPLGGAEIAPSLMALITEANHYADPYLTHVKYETLHPFMDGNGRSGRALWLWQILTQFHDWPAFRRGFLHSFYYQALGASR